MVTAGKKYLDHFGWGDAEQFHTVEHGKNKFRLFDVVKITTKSGKSITGEIGYITEEAVDILPEHQSAQRIKFEDIKNISY